MPVAEDSLDIVVQGVRIPRLLYGTAWKEDATARLVRMAIGAGFRGIDTANQRRHYHEAGVGEALAAAFKAGTVRREDLFLQTKFTFRDGQDHRLPYDATAPVAKQVEQSFASSLQHLGVETIDSLVLHGPSMLDGLADADWQAWRAMEDLQRSGRVRILGVSNVSAGQLQELHAGAAVKPAVVQNRCFTRPAADREVRGFCAEHGVGYQGFSLLTAIPGVLRHPRVKEVAARTARTPAQVVLGYCMEVGMVVLTGTTSPEHMAQDLAAARTALTREETVAIAALVGD
jgi:diketogulonate reductase-like aldo/keto reductase